MLRNKLGKLSEFNKNLIILLSSSVSAQLLPILISPILTRIYSPKDFGVFSLFISISYIFGSIVNLRYEMPIILSGNKEVAKKVVVLGFALNLTFTSFISILLFLFKAEFILLVNERLLEPYLIYLPFSIFIFGVYNLLYNLCLREKEFKFFSKVNIYRSIILSAIQIIFGLISKTIYGLIFGQIISFLISSLIMSMKFNMFKNKPDWSISKYKKLAFKYISFPLYDMPAVLLNTLAFYMTPLLLTSFYSASIAGYFFLSQRVLGTPLSMIAYSFTDVFKEKASSDFKTKGEFKDIFESTFKKLCIISILPAFVAFFTIRWVFNYVFGIEWNEAGIYSQILMPSFLLRFISTPLSIVINILNYQKLNLLLQFLLCFSLAAIFFLNLNPIDLIIGISIIYTTFYIIQILISARLAKVF